MPEPINSCTFSIDESFISISRPAENGEPYPTVIAKAPTPKVLADIMGETRSTMPTQFGILPRGVRYISADRTTFAIEYPPQEVSVLLPAHSGRDIATRIVKLWLPKHFICVKFDGTFTNIVGAAICVSYGYNYTLDDPVQTLFSMREFEFPIVPTPTLNTDYKSVGAFLSVLRERIFGHAFAILNADQTELDPGSASLPAQFTQDVANETDFYTWWENQGEHVLDWTFENPKTSTLAKIMYVDAEQLEEGVPDLSKMDYPDIIALLIAKVNEHDVLPAELARKKAQEKLSKGYASWRNNYSRKNVTNLNKQMPEWYESILTGANS